MYDIPKEIKAKPKLFGIEIKEFSLLVLSFFLVITVFSDFVHSTVQIPYYVVMSIILFWLFMPSSNNQGLKNYQSIFLYFKKDRQTYHSLDINRVLNKHFEEGDDLDDY